MAKRRRSRPIFGADRRRRPSPFAIAMAIVIVLLVGLLLYAQLAGGAPSSSYSP